MTVLHAVLSCIMQVLIQTKIPGFYQAHDGRTADRAGNQRPIHPQNACDGEKPKN